MQIFKQITANNIRLQSYPFLKELAMEAYLIENEDILRLDEENFSDVSVLDAEIALKSGVKANGGRIDILAKYGGEYLAVVELKLAEINEDTLHQLQNYLDQKEQILKYGSYWSESVTPKWIGVLIGASISAELQEKLSSGHLYNGTPIAGMVIRRFRSEQNDIFVISDTYFKFNYSTKDYSKFVFNSQQYNKGRLVNSVLKFYVERNPDITYAELKRIFPDNIQGTFGVFQTKAKAEDIYQRWGHKRYYINPEEFIQIKDETIATCNQWQPSNISSFLKRSDELGINITIK